MKKLLGVIIFSAAVAVSGICASAQVGDVAGQIYSTDILAYVNGYKAEAYNIGGKTAVVIEDLNMYGMEYDFHEDTRELYAYILLNTDNEFWFENQQYDAPYPSISVERGQVGEILGDIYETDIKVIFAGHEIQGYNIGGKTAVCMEDLGTPDGTSPNEQYGYTKYMCNFEWNEKDREVKLNGLAGHSSFSNMPAVDYYQTDNYVKALYNEEHLYNGSHYIDITNESAEEAYIIKPLYLTAGDETSEVGYSFMVRRIDYSNEEYYRIENAVTDLDKSKEMIEKLRPAPLPYEDVVKKFDDGVNYKTLDKMETEDYMLIIAQNLKLDNVSRDIKYILAVKSGGYYCIGGAGSYQEITLKKAGKNQVDISVYPFGGPHGPTTMTTKYDFDELFAE